jgi:hypothetical protein
MEEPLECFCVLCNVGFDTRCTMEYDTEPERQDPRGNEKGLGRGFVGNDYGWYLMSRHMGKRMRVKCRVHHAQIHNDERPFKTGPQRC